MLALLLGFLLSACRPEDPENEPTPTAFPVQIPSQRVTTAAPIPIALENLAANPDFYLGATLHLTGHFRRLPLLACEGEIFPSPVTWGLEANGFLANASGMDKQLRSLLDEDQLITVEGRWLKYEGPIGCESNVQDQTIWYLSTDRVIDPHPLVRLQDSPVVESEVAAELVAEIPAATIEQTVQATLSSVSQPTTAATITAVPSFTPLAAAEAPAVAATAAATPFTSPTALSGVATATLIVSETPTALVDGVPSSTPAGSGNSPGDQATATVSATPGASSTPGASATPSGIDFNDKGNLETEDLIISTLGTGATDRWMLDLFTGDVITITVAPGSMASMVLSILDSNGTPIVSEQNLAPAGNVETVKDLSITSPGIHELLIRTDQGTQTDYALMFMDADSYSFIFRGTIVENSTRNESLDADTDHFWFFNAQSGESASFSITPDSVSDPYIELYDPGGARMLTIDDTGEGEAESLDTYTLLDTGLYGIRVAEFDFRPMSYQISLTKP